VKNSSDNVFRDISVAKDEPSLLNRFLDAHDYADNSRRAVRQDVRKFARWFTEANREPFAISRVTLRDVSDFRDHARRNLGLSVSTINRALVMLRRYFGWLTETGHLTANPVLAVKELRQQMLAPKGMQQSEVRRLLREVELRNDIRAGAIFSLFLYTGCRVGDLVALDVHDIVLGERTGLATFRLGKGNKQRTVPLPLPVRKAMQAYLESRPPIDSDKVFIGERGPLTAKGVRAICDKYSAICGVKLHPHLLRHTFSHRFLETNNNDLVALAQILGHSNLNTTKRYVQKTNEQLGEASDRLDY
jgi:site-specific recombinase XerD